MPPLIAAGTPSAESAKRLFGYLNNSELADILETAGSRTSGTKEQRLERIILERIARQKNTKITVSRTLDRKEALKDADAVILSITIGGRETDFRSFEVCAKYGVPVGIV